MIGTEARILNKLFNKIVCIKTRMTASINSEDLCNHIKDMWKMKVEKISKSTKKSCYFYFFYIYDFCSLPGIQTNKIFTE